MAQSKKDQEKVNRNLDTYFSYRTSWLDGIRKSEESMNFFFGDGQWDASTRLKLNRKKLPALVKNLILPTINRMSGMEIQNQTDLAVTARKGASEVVAHAMTKMNFHYKDVSELNWLFSQAFVIGIISEMGAYVRPFFSNADDPLGGLKYNMIYGPNVLVDPMFRKYNIHDASSVIFTCWITQQDALARFPDKRKELKQLELTEPFQAMHRINRKVGFMTDLVEGNISGGRDSSSRFGGRFRLIERWTKKNFKDAIIFDPETEQTLRPNNSRERAEALFERPNAFPTTKTRSEMHVDTSLSFNIMLSSGLAQVQNGEYPFKPFYPYFLNGDMMGVVHNLKDYQREHNKRSSAILHTIMSTSNSGWLIPEGSVDPDRWEQDSSATGADLYYHGGKPEKITANSMPQGLFMADQMAKEGIGETSGIGPNLQGRAENSRESGRLFTQRVEQGNIMLLPLFNNYSYTKNLVGRENIWHYQNTFDRQQISNIIRESEEPQAIAEADALADEIASNVDIGKYDVATENIAKAAHTRELTQRQIFQIINTAPPELISWGEVIRLTDAPPDVKEKMARFAESRQGAANEVQDAATALQSSGVAT